MEDPHPPPPIFEPSFGMCIFLEHSHNTIISSPIFTLEGIIHPILLSPPPRPKATTPLSPIWCSSSLFTLSSLFTSSSLFKSSSSWALLSFLIAVSTSTLQKLVPLKPICAGQCFSTNLNFRKTSHPFTTLTFEQTFIQGDIFIQWYFHMFSNKMEKGQRTINLHRI